MKTFVHFFFSKQSLTLFIFIIRCFINWGIVIIVFQFSFFFQLIDAECIRSYWHCRFKDDLPFHMNNRQVACFTLVCGIQDLYATAFYLGETETSMFQAWSFSHDCPLAVPITDLHFRTYSFVLYLFIHLSPLLKFEHTGFS